MGTKFFTAIAKGEDSYIAGKTAAEKAMNKLQGDKPSLTIVFASSCYDYKEVVRAVREVNQKTPLIGCSTAGEFTEEGVGKKSVSVAMISTDNYKFFTSMVSGLKENYESAFKSAAEVLPENVLEYPFKSAIILHDGLAGRGEESVLSAAMFLGNDVQFCGGAAGDDLAFKATFVFCDDNVLENAVTICKIFSKKQVLSGVKHGHLPVTSNLKVTKAVDNVVYEVDGKPAWDVWKDCLREKAKEVGIDVDNLKDFSAIGSFLVMYELGLNTDEGYKIRVPLGKNEDGSLNFACSVPKDTVFKIMESPKQGQINSAREAAQIAKKNAQNIKLAGAIIFDCVCRGLILGEEFNKGIDAIKGVIGNIPLLGFETYGEICMAPNQFSGFHNTTTVVMLFPD